MSSRRGSKSRSHCFPFLLAFGVLNHTHTLGGLGSSFSVTAIPATFGEALLEISAVGLLIWPSSRRLLMTMSVGIAISVLFKMPSVSNHWLALGVLTLAYIALGLATLREPDAQRRRTAIAAGSMYLGAIVILSVWFLAAFHKLNSGFFDAVHSCAVDHANDLTDLFGMGRPVDGGLIGVLLIAAAIGAEISIPFLLLIRRRRMLGLVFVFVFHMVMAINGHQAFSGLALALYVPFLPAEIWSGFDRHDLWERVTYRYIQAAGLFMVLAGGVLYLMDSNYKLQWRGRLFYIVGSIMVAVVVYRAFKRAGASGVAQSTVSSMLSGLDQRMRRTITVISMVVIAAFAINGLSPYLGVKTQLTISMYSNLRVESEERWNHFLVPEAVRVFGNDDDVIRVASIGSQDLEWLEGRLMHRFDVRRRISGVRNGEPIGLRYQVDGSTTCTPKLADACDSEFGDAPSSCCNGNC